MLIRFKRDIRRLILILLIFSPLNLYLFIHDDNSETCINDAQLILEKNDELAFDKIDSQLLEFINSKDNKQMNVPIFVLYDYNDDVFKAELKEKAINQIYDYKIIHAMSLQSSCEDVYSIAQSTSVKKVLLDKKVYPLSTENIILENDGKERNNKDDDNYFEKPYFPLLSESNKLIGSNRLWDIKVNGSGVLVAVIDTGIDKSHLDLNDLDDNPLTDDPKVLYEKSFIDFDYNEIPEENCDDRVGHGTHVAGIISGTGEASSYEYKGVAPGSSLMNIKALTTYGGFDSWIIKGIEYAVYGDDGILNTEDDADIISMSLGGSGFIDDLIVQAVEAAWDLNKTVVIAAGNSGEDFFTIKSPGLSDKVITVGASDGLDRVAEFSSRGPSPDLRTGIDLCAPGVNIVSALANQTIRDQTQKNYTSKSGTSMATPFVAGSVALLLQSDPDLHPTTIKAALMTTADDLGTSTYIQGAGRIDVCSAYYLLNKLTGTSKTLPRVNLTNSIDISSGSLFAEIKPAFNFDFFGDIHREGNYGVGFNDLRDMFFAIRYNTSEEQKYYTSSELIQVYPREMRWLINNATHKIAIETLKTPDDFFKIDVIYENYNDSKWMRVNFEITSLKNFDVNNTKFYLYMEPGIGYDGFHDGEFIQNINSLVANNTSYYDYIDRTINNFLGFSSINESIAYDINDWDNVLEKLDNDTLKNNSLYNGYLALVQEWLNSTFVPNSRVSIPIVLAFGENRSEFVDNIKKGKKTPVFKFSKPDIAIKSLSISKPVYNGTETYLNVSITNVGYFQSSSFNVFTYIDNDIVNQTQIGPLNPGEEIFFVISIVFNRTGYNDVKIVADYFQDEYENADRNNRLNRKINVITPFIAYFSPHSPLDNPLNLKYAGQYIYWKCSILQGEKFDSLKLNKTGMGKSFVSFDGNSKSVDSLSIKKGIGQYYVNISIDLPKETRGKFDFSLQLLNSSMVLQEIPIQFEISEDLPAQLIIVNSTIEDEGPEDGDGIVEGEEYGEVSFCIKSVNGSENTYIYEPFLIVTSRNDSSIDILTYNIEFEEYSLKTNETTWNNDYNPFLFNVAYNYSNSRVCFNSIIFAQLDYSNDFIPFFQPMINFSIQQRVSGIPDLEFDSYETMDIDSSDLDGLVEPGEVGALELYFKNIGDGSALQIHNTDFTCSDSRIEIPQPYYVWEIFIFRFFIPTLYIQWNGIDPGDRTYTYSSFLIFILPSSIPVGTVLEFEVDIEYCNKSGDIFKETLQFNYVVPSNAGSGGANGDDDDDKDNDFELINFLHIGIGLAATAAAGIFVLIYLKKMKKASITKENMKDFIQNKDIS